MVWRKSPPERSKATGWTLALMRFARLPWNLTINNLNPFSERGEYLMNALEFPFPDSPIARAANQLVLEVSPPFLYYHCARTYVFAHVLGSREKIHYDQELLYLGALLHDLGLTERFDDHHPFEIARANAARTFLYHCVCLPHYPARARDF